MKKRIIILLFALMTFVSISSITNIIRAAPEAVTLDKWIIGAGGNPSTVGALTLQYTLGQPVVGEVETGARYLCSGYWCDPLYRIYLPMAVRIV